MKKFEYYTKNSAGMKKGLILEVKIWYISMPVFRRSTRKIPTFPSSRLSSSVPSNLDFSHIYRKFLMPFLGSFLLKKFLGYVIIIVLYSTLFGGRLWHTI